MISIAQRVSFVLVSVPLSLMFPHARRCLSSRVTRSALHTTSSVSTIRRRVDDLTWCTALVLTTALPLSSHLCELRSLPLSASFFTLRDFQPLINHYTRIHCADSPSSLNCRIELRLACLPMHLPPLIPPHLFRNINPSRSCFALLPYLLEDRIKAFKRSVVPVVMPCTRVCFDFRLLCLGGGSAEGRLVMVVEENRLRLSLILLFGIRLVASLGNELE